MNTIQSQEFLYTWYQDHDDDFRPGEWWAHVITKRTKKLVFVQYKIGGYLSRYPRAQNMRLRRDELEAKGETYWHDGSWVECFYTEEKKNLIEAHQRTRNIPECLKFFGLTREATIGDVQRAYHKAALKDHPDSGGTHDGFLKLQEHYESALKLVR